MVVASGSDGRRQRRAAENVRGALGEILLRDVSDPNLASVTISDVVFSPDLRNAKIFYTTIDGDSSNRVKEGLKRAAPFLQRELGTKLKMRFTPKLTFQRDETFEQGFKIDRIIMENKIENQKAVLEETPEQSLARLVTDLDKILLCAHSNPDGDAVGSLLGMHRILKLMGKNPVPFCSDGIPATLRFLPGSDEVVETLADDSFEMTIVMDTSDEKLLPIGLPDISKRGTVAVIDHHAVHGKLGDLVIRRNVSAVGELIFDLARELVWPLDKEVAQCLYTSIVSDTGSFRYTSTTPDTHRVSAELLELGADPWKSATALYESFSLNRQKLLAAVASTLKLSDDGRYADLYCTLEMLDKTGATREDLSGMINLGRSVAGVEIAALFRVEKCGDVKASFRSKGRVDVARLAVQFGGGGHRNAAGATLENAHLEKTIAEVREAAQKLLADNGEENG